MSLTRDTFLSDIKSHKMSILRDDGIYRHIKFAKPDTNWLSFELVTWENHLAYGGDMGYYIFTRLPDMFNFFRSDSKRINPSYWAEKVVCVDGNRHISTMREFDEDGFNRRVIEYMIKWFRYNKDTTTKDDRRGIWEDVIWEIIREDDPTRKKIAVNDFSRELDSEKWFEFVDFFEGYSDKYTDNFIWACFAIVWGIEQYDLVKQLGGDNGGNI